ncbi:MAG: sulfurtransferase [Gammaproteobacteria bacterium]|nr:sulfurtransferase [Gammaproteobacteria bacterium]NNF62090.1 sulfurtransferase [Gammaproteobacteria bacterium]NNM20474.1 sulfurtransferase [Gammaproteobacteria bacterium]
MATSGNHVQHRNLVSHGLLAAHCEEPDWVLLDCRYSLADPAAGRARWEQGHIPGAVHADLENELSAPASPRGRHPLPDPVELAGHFSDWGISMETQVVAYDDSHGAFAARAWWLLRWLGHDAVAVLDGGLQAWRRAGLPLTNAVPDRKPAHFEIRLRDQLRVDADEVAQALKSDGCVLDARAAERFLGEQEPLDRRAGHIPGAHNYPFTANLDRDGRFLSPSELRVCFDAARQSTSPKKIICMCGSGVTACHNLLALEIAQLPGARLFPGSWSEWCADPQRPIASGPDTN